jgi:peptidoglycan/xylan/chitin deacetylase (PgdA/CDA1 family)
MSVRRWLEAGQSALPRANGGVAVLAYHLVGASTASPVDISVDDFRRQMHLLRETCDVRSLDDALDHAVAGARPVVVLTFDDAYLNFRKVAWPILAELGLPVMLYVPVGFVNGASGCPIHGAALEPCSWDDLGALVREGVSIGSHTVRHVNLARAPAAEVERELKDSRSELEQRLGVEAKSFCYPQAKWNGRVAQQAALVYDSAVIAGGRRFICGRTNRHRIPRFPVRRDVGSFESMVHARVWLGEALANVIRQRLP